jgi:hypothetical protein
MVHLDDTASPDEGTRALSNFCATRGATTRANVGRQPPVAAPRVAQPRVFGGDAHPREAHYNEAMASARLIARVKNGRLVLDVPTTLPEGAAVALRLEASAAPDGGDDLDEAERAELHEEIRHSVRQLEAGEGIDGDTVMAKLRARLSP